MRAADFLIGKPGPGSIAEAMVRKLPVLIECNAWTLPQERYNAEWVKEKGVGIALKSFGNVVEGVKRMLDPATLAKFRKSVAAQNNRAVFEIPEILAKLLGESNSTTEGSTSVRQIAVNRTALRSLVVYAIIRNGKSSPPREPSGAIPACPRAA